MTAPRSETRAELRGALQPSSGSDQDNTEAARIASERSSTAAAAHPSHRLSRQGAIVRNRGPLPDPPSACQGPHPPPVARYRSSTPDLQPPRCLADGYQRSRMPRVTSRPQRRAQVPMSRRLGFPTFRPRNESGFQSHCSRRESIRYCLLELLKKQFAAMISRFEAPARRSKISETLDRLARLSSLAVLRRARVSQPVSHAHLQATMKVLTATSEGQDSDQKTGRSKPSSDDSRATTPATCLNSHKPPKTAAAATSNVACKAT